jgi:chloramphenicol-sensitive protein RarD
VGETSGSSSIRGGILFGLIAYGCWGLVPLYFHEFKADSVPALQILAHRIVWSMLLLGVLTVALGYWRDIVRVLSTPRLVATLGLSAFLLAINWLLYIYATVTGRVAEASLGYYMMPLVNAFLATTVLGERLRRAHYPALGLVACGVAVPFAWNGDFTWIAVALPVSFACYGLVRKLAPVDSFTGLTVETLLMVIPSAGFLLNEAAAGRGVFGPNARLNGLLMASAIVTIVPLLTFTLSIRRMPLIANSFIQFVSPTIQLLIAVVWIGEALTPERWAAMAFVWVAVCIFLADAVAQMRTKRTHIPIPESEPAVEIEPDLLPPGVVAARV